MSKRPRFERNPFTDLRESPGATNHRAGRSPEQRIAALEQSVRVVAEGGAGLLIPKSAFTEKGGILVGTGDGTFEELVPPGDGYQLTSDMSQPSGWRVAAQRAASLDVNTGRSAGAATNYVYATRDGLVNFFSAAGSARAAMYLPAGKLRIRAWVLTETAPTASNVKAELFRCTSFGASGTLNGVVSVGSVTIPGVSGTNALHTAESSVINVETPGMHVVGFQHSTTPGQTLTYGYELLSVV